MPPILSVRDLSKHFEGVIALEQVNLSIEKGEIRSIIGPNGSGKTTLINLNFLFIKLSPSSSASILDS